MEESEYTWNEVLMCTRMYWTIRERGNGSSFASARMLDISRAYEILTTSERSSLFLGVWLEQQSVPTAVIAKMKHYLNGSHA
jgi:hypothetical protein